MKPAVEGIYRNGNIEFLEEIHIHKPMKVIVVFTEEVKEEENNKGWLTLAESAFEFWNNEEDAYYDDI